MRSPTLDITKDIQSLTTFRRRSAAAVVQDAEAYQRLLDTAASAEVEEGIRQRVDDGIHRRTRPATEVFDAIRRKHGIPL